MNRIKTTALAAAAILVGSFAQAGEIELTKPIAAASLHEPGVDMVVYYTEAANGYDVVATYIETQEPAQPYRMIMTLNDGDNVTFHLPGYKDTNYTFVRSGETVRVTSETTTDFAQLAQ